MRKKRLFLLGGMDLEMDSIKKLLEEHHEIFIDRLLGWSNARLSNYADLIETKKNEYTCIYGIELEEDIAVPKNYIRIDHHNDFSTKKSSLEQVANILNCDLNRYQQLVAANDCCYINGLEELIATQKEIEQIRLLDRKYQGVTAAEESVAEMELKTNCLQVGSLLIVKTSLDRFSPFTDRLYPFEELIVFNDKELVYYGINKKKLLRWYESAGFKDLVYHGGGDTGFVGFHYAEHSKISALKIIDEIKLCLNDT